MTTLISRARYAGAAILLFSSIAAVAAEGPLGWDATEKTHQAQPGDAKADFTFTAFNRSNADITVKAVTTSCGCTVAKFRTTPLSIPPGGSADLHATVDIRGKSGQIEKTISVDSSVGRSALVVKVDAGSATVALDARPLMIRAQNIEAAVLDRQAVFRNADCAKCHAEPLSGKRGKALYADACGICHDSPHRATMVPDLHAIAAGADRAFWRERVAHGKSGSLMPAFARTEGGPLDDAQMESLVEYLVGLPRAAVVSSATLAPAGEPRN